MGRSLVYEKFPFIYSSAEAKLYILLLEKSSDKNSETINAWGKDHVLL